ncbi:ABC transporter ATP-binding protein [Kineosporia sp. J2-2]|uniref:ABC transporter ATP-binding protein n=1 Tax=Kineosporia corallincola TaxID=2835133 RepID=A0ABS5TC88_9ACTN|nr:ABC transporter ATP-binding protein [Kineosporia corallincola]MBT0768695.1 ABC transporter ATP-binding protein [Kineosporia corallincola]
MTNALSVSGLSVAAGPRIIVEDIDLTLERGQAVGVVGESGSGKSMILKAIMALLPAGVKATAGQITLDGKVLPHNGGRKERGHRLGLVLQDPATALDPLMRVGDQIAEVRRHVIGRDRVTARQEALDLLERVQIQAGRYRHHPHELSGGQRQRVVIARALAAEPEFLLCDEPTTALDVTVQAEILALLEDLRTTRHVGLLFVSHDLAVVARVSSRLVVMRHGRIVERGTTEQVLTHPEHAYTRELLDSVVELSVPEARA